MRRVRFLQRQIKQILKVRYVNYEFYNFDFIYKKAKTQIAKTLTNFDNYFWPNYLTNGQTKKNVCTFLLSIKKC